MPTDPTTQDAYTDLVHAIRDLGAILGPAVAARYEAPPGGAAGGGGLIPNPTLDIVIDPRRLALSEQVASVTATLRRATRLIGAHTESLDAALARWEGGEGPVSCTAKSSTPDRRPSEDASPSTLGFSPKPAPPSAPTS